MCPAGQFRVYFWDYKLNVLTWLDLLLLCMIIYLCSYQDFFHSELSSVKQGGIKYHFLSLWYDLTWDWIQVSRAIGEHANLYIYIYIYNQQIFIQTNVLIFVQRDKRRCNFGICIGIFAFINQSELLHSFKYFADTFTHNLIRIKDLKDQRFERSKSKMILTIVSLLDGWKYNYFNRLDS